MMREKTFYIYLLTNKRHTVIYTGMTNDLVRRVWEHKEKVNRGFTSKYNVNKLVYFEEYPNPQEAIDREKQIKAGSRQKKLDLIEEMNSEWKDLYEELLP